MTDSGRARDGDAQLARALSRRGFLQALLAVVGALVAVGLVWVISRDAPSAGRDPEFTPPAPAPTRPAPTATPAAVGG